MKLIRDAATVMLLMIIALQVDTNTRLMKAFWGTSKVDGVLANVPGSATLILVLAFAGFFAVLTEHGYNPFSAMARLINLIKEAGNKDKDVKRNGTGSMDRE